MSRTKLGAVLDCGPCRPLAIRPRAFVFCKRDSGAMRIQVDAAPDGTIPFEWAAALLAMHCFLRGEKPCDYTMLVVPQGSLLDPVGQLAQELLEATKTAIGGSVQLSPREQQVLECVRQQQSNKEIGVRLHVAERTVKFHVSSLLAKFRVRDRIDLALKAVLGLLPTEVSPPDTLFETASFIRT